MKIMQGGQIVQDTSSSEYKAQARNTLNLTTAQAKHEAEFKKQLAKKDTQLAEQKAALETQVQANTQQAQLLQGYQTQEETSRKEGLVKNLMQGLSNQEHAIVLNALKAFSTDAAKPQRFLTFADRSDVSSEYRILNLDINHFAESLTKGNLALANKLIEFILDYNNLPATKLDGKEEGKLVYEFEQRRDTQAGNNFSLRNVKFALPELTEGEKLKGSPTISLNGVPCLNDAQKQAEMEQRKTTLEKIREKVIPPVATLLISSGLGVGLNSISNNPVSWLPDLTPNPQVSIQSNQPPASILELSREDMIKIRDRDFQKVEVQAGDGYTQLFERYLSKDLKKLGIEKITPENTELAFIVNLSQAMTNLENQANNLDLPKLTDSNMIKKIPDGVTEVYIPKKGVLDSLINGYKIPPAPGPEVQQKHS